MPIINEEKEIAQQVRSGAYFNEALSWYQVRYIAPVSERALFLVIGIIAIFVGLVGLIALLLLLPITSHPPILIPSIDIYQQIPKITGLREPKEPLNDGMRKFFLAAYVSKRESYLAKDFAAAYTFVGAHSDPVAARQYLADIARDNPQSAFYKVGATGRRDISIQTLSVNEKLDPPVATMTYIARDTVDDQSTHTQWQATVSYHYTPIMVKEVVDKDGGETIIQTEEPQFQVVKYERQQIIPPSK